MQKMFGGVRRLFLVSVCHVAEIFHRSKGNKTATQNQTPIQGFAAEISRAKIIHSAKSF